MHEVPGQEILDVRKALAFAGLPPGDQLCADEASNPELRSGITCAKPFNTTIEPRNRQRPHDFNVIYHNHHKM